MKIALPLLALVLAAAGLSACADVKPIPSAPGQPSSTDVNPITGSRGGSGSSAGSH